MARKEREVLYRCPHCREQITRLPENHTDYTCPRCRARYRVMLDEETHTAAFVDRSTRPSVRPLGLPKGSVRALVALLMTGACAVLVVRGHDVPGSLASLLLTIIAFYFGFRSEAATLSDRVYDPSARREHPLYLPAGAIRTLLILACLCAALSLLYRGRMVTVPVHLELFVILAGLIAGRYFSRIVRGGGAGLAHAKAALAVAMAAGLAWLFGTETYLSLSPHVVMLLCAAISFYYGSRT
jgi:DNA-directed RNA polymerase subunit RPC12/RpoP